MLLASLLFLAMWLAPSWLVLRVCCRNVSDFPFVVADFTAAFLTATVSLIFRGGKPRFPEWTPALEITQSVMHGLMAKYGEVVVLEQNAKRMRRLTDIFGSIQGWFSCREFDTTLQRVTRNGLEHLWIRSKAPSSVPDSNKYTVLYCHGGGYTILSPPLYIALCNRLRKAIIDAVKVDNDRMIEVDVFLANYRKAPEFKYPVPHEDVLLMYEYLRDQENVPASRLILAGDSAGGGLVLSTLMRLRNGQKQSDQPLVAILSFPWVDFADNTNPKRGEDCIIAEAFVTGSIKAVLPTWKDNSTWKDISALYCDLHGLAPALIQVGTQDYLHQDSVKLFEKQSRTVSRTGSWTFERTCRMFSAHYQRKLCRTRPQQSRKWASSSPSRSGKPQAGTGIKSATLRLVTGTTEPTWLVAITILKQSTSKYYVNEQWCFMEPTQLTLSA